MKPFIFTRVYREKSSKRQKTINTYIFRLAMIHLCPLKLLLNIRLIEKLFSLLQNMLTYWQAFFGLLWIISTPWVPSNKNCKCVQLIKILLFYNYKTFNIISLARKIINCIKIMFLTRIFLVISNFSKLWSSV